MADTGRGFSISGAGKGNCGGVGSSHGESMSSSLEGAVSGVGEANGNGRSLERKLKGALCGRGEMSMESGAKQGDEEGIGGVVTPSHRTGGVVVPSACDVSATPIRAQCLHVHIPRFSSCWNRLDVKRDLRGVAS